MSLCKDFYGDPLSSEWAESDSLPTDSLVLEDPLNTGNDMLNPTFLDSISQSNPKRPNFGTNSMRCFITRETWVPTNITGKRGKRKLHPNVISTINIATFNAYPCAPGENKEVYRKACVKAIDKANHQLYRKKPAKATTD